MRRSYNDDRSGFGGGYGSGGGRFDDGRRGPRDGDGSRGESMDEPPNSRLFIIGGKTLTEGEFKEAFGAYGQVERVDVKRDKGISYIKFAKTSEAADALEALNGKTIGSDPRPLKIVIASSKSAQSRDGRDVTALRLYLIIPKSLTEADLRSEFEQFGPLEYVSVVTDKVTKENRGFGYVKFFQFSHAARAYEGCDQSYRPKFADPRPERGSFGGSSFGGSDYGGFGGRGAGPAGKGGNELPTSISNPMGTCKLAIMVNPILSQEKLWKLFDIVPGLLNCEIHTGDPSGERNYGTVVYDTPKAAAYAMEKLHGFDYPLGSRVMIKFEEDGYGGRSGNGMGGGFGGGGAGAAMPADVKNLVSTIQHATQMLAASGYVAPEALAPMSSVIGGVGEVALDTSMCSPYVQQNLPPGPVEMASLGTPCAQRLFFVCKESREVPPPHIIKDLFSRFGNCIEAYLMKGKNCGYAKYADSSSAQRAIQVLNEQTVMGCFLKVMVADESSNKRARTD